MVFHRFINRPFNPIKIYINDDRIRGLDPFLEDHPKTDSQKPSPINCEGTEIIVQQFILPHQNDLSNDDIEKLGGIDFLRNGQGFYVYRNRRLIIWGTWFRLERKDELSKLARVMVDIPNSLDYMWSIDIKKSTAILPDVIKKNMYNAVYESVLPLPNGPGIAAIPPFAIGNRQSITLCPVIRGLSGESFF